MTGRAPAVRLDSVQVLRAVAAVSVVLFHIGWTGIASFGVELFFVLSGFIIAYAAAFDPRHFLAKRLARIVPLYWGATFGIAAIGLIAPGLLGGTQVTLANLLRSLAFIPYQRADGQGFPLLYLGWTLNYELAFYLVFAFCLAVSRRWAPALAAALLFGLASLHSVVAPWGFAADFWTRPILLNFVIGLAAFGLWTRRAAWLDRVPPGAAILVAAAAFGLLLTGAMNGAAPLLPAKAALGGLLLLALVRLDRQLHWPAPVLLIGDASYSLYLLHPYVLQTIGRFVHPLAAAPAGVAASLFALALALACAVVSYRVVERPANRRLRAMLAGRGRADHQPAA